MPDHFESEGPVYVDIWGEYRSGRTVLHSASCVTLRRVCIWVAVRSICPIAMAPLWWGGSARLG